MSRPTGARSTPARSASTTGWGGAMPSIGLLGLVLAFAAPGHGDLSVSGVSVTRTGTRLVMTDTVRNLGLKRTPRTRVEYRIVGRTRVLATRVVPSLAPGRASRARVRLTVPSASAHVVACVDAA